VKRGNDKSASRERAERSLLKRRRQVERDR
jgi:hypothetical protein